MMTVMMTMMMMMMMPMVLLMTTLSATCMRPSQQPLQGGPKPSKAIGVLVILKKVANTLVVLHFFISESATLQAFLLLLFSKCKHSNDFTIFSQNNYTNI